MRVKNYKGFMVAKKQGAYQLEDISKLGLPHKCALIRNTYCV